jgi:predicted ATPase
MMASNIASGDATRSHALSKLAASGEVDVVRRRHAERALAMAEHATLEGRRLTQMEWIARHAHALDEIRTASRWAFTAPFSAEFGVKLTIAAIPLWKRLSLAEECRAAVARALDDRFAIHRTPSQEMVLQQTLASTLLDIQGTLPEAKVALESALAIAVSLGDTARQLECLRGLSEYELWTGDSNAVLALADRMRAIAGENAEAADVSADVGAGAALEWLGDLDGARRHLDKALNRERRDYTRFDDERFAFNQRLLAQVSMIHVLWLQGLADQAKTTAHRMMEEAEASHYAWSYCFARFQSATLSLHLRDYATARRQMTEGMDHAAKHGITFWRGTVLAGQHARWKLYMGQLVDLAEMRLVLLTMRERGSRMYYPHLLTNYGEAVARQSDLREGLAAIDEAIALCEATGQIVVIPEVVRIKGNVIRWQDPPRWRQAADCYRRSIDLARRDGTLAWEIRAAISLVKLTRAQGGDTEAEDALDSAYGRFSEGFGSGDLVRARALLDAR